MTLHFSLTPLVSIYQFVCFFSACLFSPPPLLFLLYLSLMVFSLSLSLYLSVLFLLYLSLLLFSLSLSLLSLSQGSLLEPGF